MFEINDDTLSWLKKLEGPIGVISVAGMYRTGKSYLLNRVLLNQSRGFDVGPTINACTKVRIQYLILSREIFARCRSFYLLIIQIAGLYH